MAAFLACFVDFFSFKHLKLKASITLPSQSVSANQLSYLSSSKDVISSQGYLPKPRRIFGRLIFGDSEEGAAISYGADRIKIGTFLASDFKPGKGFYWVDLAGNRQRGSLYSYEGGLGFRYHAEDWCKLLGLYSYYNWRQGFVGNYHRLDFGIECLGRRWDLRVNGYFPIGNRDRTHGFTQFYPGGYFINYRYSEYNLLGCNGEIGYTVINGKDWSLYFAGGPYFFKSPVECLEPLIGGELRIRPQWKDVFFVEAKFSWDNTYRFLYQTTIGITFPLYELYKDSIDSGKCGFRRRQIFQPTERFDLTPLNGRSCWNYRY